VVTPPQVGNVLRRTTSRWGKVLRKTRSECPYILRTDRRRWEEKLDWYRRHRIQAQEEGGGAEGTLIITRDEANGSIDSAAIAKLVTEVLS
jgi:hypothetical protein